MSPPDAGEFQLHGLTFFLSTTTRGNAPVSFEMIQPSFTALELLRHIFSVVLLQVDAHQDADTVVCNAQPPLATALVLSVHKLLRQWPHTSSFVALLPQLVLPQLVGLRVPF